MLNNILMSLLAKIENFIKILYIRIKFNYKLCTDYTSPDIFVNSFKVFLYREPRVKICKGLYNT